MVEESPVMLPPAEESIEAETDTGLEPEPESGEPAPEPTSEPGFVCDCGDWMASACQGLPFYKAHENRRYCVLHYPGKEKSADFKAALDSKLSKKDFSFQGVWFPDEVDFSRFEFSADADFRAAMFIADANFVEATFSAGADFGTVTFGANVHFNLATFRTAARFYSATFSADAFFHWATFSADANFVEATFRAYATFSDATFSADADFSKVTFRGNADFREATFSADADFSDATFSADADFEEARFDADTDFSGATLSADTYFGKAAFSDVDFNLSVFHTQADFSRATFNDSIHFFGSTTERLLKGGVSLAAMALGTEPALDFQHARVERPEHIAFHTLSLRPHWFVNIDSRHFVFTDVSWEWERISINDEIAALEINGVSSPNRLLAIACRQLAENAEANNRYEEASRFRYWAMDLARRTKWKGWSFWKTDWLHMLYWAVSGYGERILRALGVLAAVWIVFVMLYTRVGFAQQAPSNQAAPSVAVASMTIEDRIGQPLEFSRALTYSLAVMSLQKPEPKPLTGTAQTLVLLETILGPVQGALLALAIRRKFMR